MSSVMGAEGHVMSPYLRRRKLTQELATIGRTSRGGKATPLALASLHSLLPSSINLFIIYLSKPRLSSKPPHFAKGQMYVDSDPHLGVFETTWQLRYTPR